MGNIFSPASSNYSAGSTLDDKQAAVNTLYQKRNEAFQKSQDCFRSGDHAGAKYWSQQGKDYDRRAKACRKDQAAAIFEDRNKGSPAGEIDLHFLSVSEATVRVKAAIKQAKEDGRKSLTLIVGKGLHSGPAGPKLKPAMTKLIHQYNLRCTVGVPNEGCIFVEMVKAKDRGWFGDLIAACIIS